MSMNQTPSGERVHIGFFGMRNAGKSSLVNAVTGQDLAVVSDKKGTTTDPVYKSMELLPLGPVMIIDTPGFDDADGELGELRVKKARQVLNRTDIAVLVADAEIGLSDADRRLIRIFEDKNINYITVFNKADKITAQCRDDGKIIYACAKNGDGISEIKKALGDFAAALEQECRFVGDLLNPGDLTVLVTPIDSAAPKGRLILPQQQAIRDILDAGAAAVVTRETTLKSMLDSLNRKPALVITDSQAFKIAALQTPTDIPLTSFSILMARRKGFLSPAVHGVGFIDKLQDGDTVLISEGCTHHRQCGDIGTVKIPNMLKRFTGRNINIKTSSGTDFPEDLSEYAMIIHCGGCMLNRREVNYRVKCAAEQNVPITNYGVALAYMNGILKRSLGIFPDLAALIG